MRYRKIQLLALILIFFVTTAQRCTPTTIKIADSGTIIVQILHETEVIQDSSICRGDSVIKQKGVDGEREISYRTFLGDTVETSRKVKKEPISEIKLVGTKDCDNVGKKRTKKGTVETDVNTGSTNEVRPEPVTTPEVSPEPKCQETCPDKECGQGCKSSCGPGCQS